MMGPPQCLTAAIIFSAVAFAISQQVAPQIQADGSTIGFAVQSVSYLTLTHNTSIYGCQAGVLVRLNLQR